MILKSVVSPKKRKGPGAPHGVIYDFNRFSVVWRCFGGCVECVAGITPPLDMRTQRLVRVTAPSPCVCAYLRSDAAHARYKPLSSSQRYQLTHHVEA